MQMKNILTKDRQLTFLLLVNILVVLLSTLYSNGMFLELDNLQSMAGQLPELGLLAIGIGLAMIAGNGGIDLSVVAIANLAGIVAGRIAGLMYSTDTEPVQHVISFVSIALSTGLLCGLINGALVAYARLTPILSTLGTQLLFTGIAVVLTNGSAFRLGFSDEMSYMGNGVIWNIPVPFIVFVVVLGLVGALLKKSIFGIQLFLVGTNQKAADYAGIPRAKILLITYAISGLVAAIAGILIASRTASVKWDYGSSYLLIAILIAVMAGIKPDGGYGRMVCLLFSTIALQIISSSFNLFDISSFFRDCAWGLMLLLFLYTSTDSFWMSFIKRSK
jgi:simple sugar transport system permease protein